MKLYFEEEVMELLAPAGSIQTLKIAIQAGCDAVYISGKRFGARAFAVNFTNEELKDAISYAHLRGIKVYVTLNTLIYDEEFEDIKPYLEFLVENKVDAVIVQDLGLIHYIRMYYPTLIIHASTQMNINSVNGALRLMELGVKRVVLAREVPLSIIKEIVKTGIEVEVFVHGALCFAYSGQCLMSYEIGKRSGNRGECAQPCRKKYRLIENGIPISTYQSFLSMKDLCTIDELDNLREIGVTSLKIEGRMKKDAYVFAVVEEYRKRLNNQKIDKNRLYVTFNREFTKGYMFNEDNNLITNQTGVNHQGILIGKVINVTKIEITFTSSEKISLNDGIRIKGKEEIGFFITKFKQKNNLITIGKTFNASVGDLVYKTVDSALNLSVLALLEKERYKIPFKMELNAYLNHELSLKIISENYNFELTGAPLLEKASSILSNSRIIEQLQKVNDPLFLVEEVIINYDKIAFIKIKDLNSLRRLAIENLKKLILDNYEIQQNSPYCFYPSVYKKTNSSISFDFVVNNNEQVKWCEENNFKNIYLIKKFNPNYGFYNYHLTLGDVKQGLIHNFGDIQNDCILSPSSNVLNHYAIDFLSNYQIPLVYLSYEIDKDRIIKLKKLSPNFPIGVFLYGRIEMMSTKHCFINKIKNKHNLNCNSCKLNTYELEDEYHNLMTVSSRCNALNPEALIYSYKKENNFKYVNEYLENNINHFLIVLTNESVDELNQLKMLINGVVNNAFNKGKAF